MTSGDYSPEKAGVGGSTPSLATIQSIICRAHTSSLPAIATIQFTALLEVPSRSKTRNCDSVMKTQHPSPLIAPGIAQKLLLCAVATVRDFPTGRK